METKGVSDTGEGRHTTVRRELIVLANGAMVIDNPGMREFGVLGAGERNRGELCGYHRARRPLPFPGLHAYQ